MTDIPRLALVEDNPDNRLLVETLLEDDFQVESYETGTDGLAGVRAAPPALVLLDISLPGMDGVEVLKHLREDPATRGLPIIALTAHAMAGDRERYLAMGFDDYMSKPIVDPDALIAMINRLLAS